MMESAQPLPQEYTLAFAAIEQDENSEIVVASHEGEAPFRPYMIEALLPDF